MENLSQSPADTGADDSPFQNVCFVCFFLFQVLILLNHLIHQAFCFFIHFFIHLIVWENCTIRNFYSSMLQSLL